MSSPEFTPRQLALGPYVRQLVALHARSASEGWPVPGLIDVGECTLEVQQPQLDLLRSAFDGHLGDCTVLGLETWALAVKCSADLDRLRRVGHDPREVYPVQAELMLDSALGSVLLGDLRREIDSAVSSGDLDGARLLSSVHHWLRGPLREAGRSIGQTDQDRVGAIAKALGAKEPAEPTVKTRPTAQPAAEDHPRASRSAGVVRRIGSVFRIPAIASREISTSRLLGTAILATLSVWAALFGVPRMRQPSHQPPAVAAVDTEGLIVTAVDRFPSFIAAVDSDEWAGLDVVARDRFLNRLQQQLDAGGYGGLLVESADGLPLVQWSVDGGRRQLVREPILRPTIP